MCWKHAVLTTWSKKELAEKIRGFSGEAHGSPGGRGIVATLLVNGEKVMEYKEEFERVELPVSKLASECQRVAELAGLANLNLSFNPMHSWDAVAPPVGSTKSPPNFRRWFLEAFDTTRYSFEIVPDTNVIIKHHLSQTIIPIMREYFPKPIAVKIPRIVILELERQGNEEGKSWKRRLVLNAWNEILWLTDNGAKLMRELDVDLLGEFSSLSGARMADAWIRREVHADGTEGIVGSSPRRPVFLTGDLMSAFAASAEGLDALYISTDTEMKYHCPLNRFADLVVAAAVFWEEIKLEFQTPKEVMTLQGIWEGKNISDWRDEAVLPR
jgi:hypothetical protein